MLALRGKSSLLRVCRDLILEFGRDLFASISRTELESRADLMSSLLYPLTFVLELGRSEKPLYFERSVGLAFVLNRNSSLPVLGLDRFLEVGRPSPPDTDVT